MRTEPWKYLRNTKPMPLAFLVWILFLGMVAAAMQMTDQRTTATDPLLSRVGQPSELAVNEFKKAGMEEVRPHSLTDAERAKVQTALGALPSLESSSEFGEVAPGEDAMPLGAALEVVLIFFQLSWVAMSKVTYYLLF
jgi:hypothetical protein